MSTLCSAAGSAPRSLMRLARAAVLPRTVLKVRLLVLDARTLGRMLCALLWRLCATAGRCAGCVSALRLTARNIDMPIEGAQKHARKGRAMLDEASALG